MKHITVLIPCYNEADAIANVIKRFPRDRLKASGYDLEIIVIDNNSKDDTAKLAAEAGARVILEPKQGKGNAIRTGFHAISKNTDYVAMLDGDDTYRPEEILRLIEPLDSGFAKVIIGSRMQGAMRTGSMKRFNRVGNHAYTRLVRVAYHVMVTDVLTGYFAWTREAVEDLREHVTSTGFAIEMEMITKLARLDYQIYSVPVTYDPRLGDSSLQPVSDGYRILKMYMRNLRWKPSTALLIETNVSNGRRWRKLWAIELLRSSSNSNTPVKGKADNEASKHSLSI
jgi:glycosyltransferase involved in cell wall biosynthesis